MKLNLKPQIFLFLAPLLTIIASHTLAQETYTFTNAGAQGRFGPDQLDVDAQYMGTDLEGNVTINTQGIQEWTVPVSGTYSIVAIGAGGGDGTDSQNTIPGKGASMSGEIFLPADTVLKILVGQRGGDAQAPVSPCSSSINRAGGGGGGTFITYANGQPLIVAGGGNGDNWGNWVTNGPSAQLSNTGTAGGTGNRAGGGGGLTGNGSGNGAGLSFTNGGIGGLRWDCNKGDGGFGGGGGALFEGGGGGGYTGGRVVPSNQYSTSFPSYGAGSYNVTENQENLAAVSSGHGSVVIVRIVELIFSEEVSLTCNGDSTGQIKVESIGGIAPYTYLWNNGATTATISGLTAGTYSVTITDNDSSMQSGSYTLEEPIGMTINFSNIKATTCSENGDGSLEATIINGMEPLAYLWSSGDTTSSITNKAMGDHDLTVTDANGCTRQATGTIEVDDETLPTAVTKSATIYLDINGNASATVDNVNDGSFDDCAIGGMAVVNNSFDCTSIALNGTLSVDLVVTDESGNQASASAAITVVDTIKPQISVSDTILYLGSDGTGTLDALVIGIGSTDNCGIAGMSLNKSTFDCSDIGQQQVTLSVIDSSGNTATKSFTLTIGDNQAPLATLNQNQILYLNDSGTVSVTAEMVVNESSDNCSIAQQSVSASSFDCDDVGQKNISVIVEDAHGNFSQVNGQVTVADTIRPFLNLQTIELSIDTNGIANLTEAMLMPFASDNCGILEIAVQNSQFDCNNVQGGTSTQVLVVDLHGNVFQKSILITILDETVPVVQANDINIYLGAEGTATLNASMLDLFIDDNCAISSTVLQHTTYDCSDMGFNQNSVAVTDFGGNEAFASFFVNVLDTLGPTITCAPNVEMCSGTLELEAVEITDICGVQQTEILGPHLGEFLEPGNYQIEYLSVDISGNSSTCTTEITVFDLPTVELGENVQVPSGTVVTLNAATALNQTYLWSTGETTTSIDVTVTATTHITVEVTSADGCTTEDDIFLFIQTVTGIADHEKNVTMNMYPNPNAGQFNIAIESHDGLNNLQVVIMDLNGRQALTQSFANISADGLLSIDASDLAKGLYIVNLQSEHINVTQKLIIE